MRIAGFPSLFPVDVLKVKDTKKKPAPSRKTDRGNPKSTRNTRRTKTRNTRR
jgi:hypothetical protein